VTEGFKTAMNVCREVLESIAISFPSIIATQQLKLANISSQDPKFQKDIVQNSEPYNIHDSNNESDESVGGTLDQWHLNLQQFAGKEHSTNKKGGNRQVTAMLGKQSIPSISEMNYAEDVSWFFEDGEEGGEGEDEVAISRSSTDPIGKIPSYIDTISTSNTAPAFDPVTSHANMAIKGSEYNESNMDWLDLIATRLSHGNDAMMAMASQTARLMVCNRRFIYNLLLVFLLLFKI
jgi:hypothetical protein